MLHIHWYLFFGIFAEFRQSVVSAKSRFGNVVFGEVSRIQWLWMIIRHTYTQKHIYMHMTKLTVKDLKLLKTKRCQIQKGVLEGRERGGKEEEAWLGEEWSTGMWHIPLSLEVICSDTPFILCCWARDHFVLICSNNCLAYFRYQQGNCALGNSEGIV